MAELEHEVRVHKYTPNGYRTNLLPDAEYVYYGTRPYLKPQDRVLSNTLKSGRALELCQQMLGDGVTEVCLNKNVVAGMHRDRGNTGHSHIAFFGDYSSGGHLNLEDGRTFDGMIKGVWHGPFDGRRLEHHNTPHLGGDKWSCVAFSRNK